MRLRIPVLRGNEIIAPSCYKCQFVSKSRRLHLENHLGKHIKNRASTALSCLAPQLGTCKRAPFGTPYIESVRANPFILETFTRQHEDADCYRFVPTLALATVVKADCQSDWSDCMNTYGDSQYCNQQRNACYHPNGY